MSECANETADDDQFMFLGGLLDDLGDGWVMRGCRHCGAVVHRATADLHLAWHESDR